MVQSIARYSSTIVKSNNIELIDLFFKKVSEGILINFITLNQNDIESKEVLDYYLANHNGSTESGIITLGDDINICNLNEHSELVDYYEQIMKDAGKTIVIEDDEESINLLILNRIIVNPSMYSVKIKFDQLYKAILTSFFRAQFSNDQILFILSNIQIKPTTKKGQLLNFNLLFINSTLIKYRIEIIKFLFENVSKESIAQSLKEFIEGDTNLQITTSILNNNNNNSNGEDSASKIQYEYESFIISKATSITFTLSIENLLLSLYYLDHSNDILYLFETVPEILQCCVNNDNDTLLKSELYGSLSTYYLELFINYFIDNLNEITIKHLFECLCVASTNGNISLFKSLISTKNYNDYLFKIKTNNNNNNNQSLFTSKSLIEMVKKSTILELKNLLLKFINFSPKDLKLLR